MNLLFQNIKTTDEKEKLLEEIDVVLSSLYQNNGDGYSRTLKTDVRAWVADILNEELSKNETSPLNYLKKLKEELNSFKVVKISLAFEPTALNIEKFSHFIKKYVGEDTILDFTHNPTLIAGCTIIYEGKYRDLSMKSYFELEFNKIKEDLFIGMAHNISN